MMRRGRVADRHIWGQARTLRVMKPLPHDRSTTMPPEVAASAKKSRISAHSLSTPGNPAFSKFCR